MVVIGAHGKLYSHSSVKLSATKNTPMLPLKDNSFSLGNILIQRIGFTTCISLNTFQIIRLFMISYL